MVFIPLSCSLQYHLGCSLYMTISFRVPPCPIGPEGCPFSLAPPMLLLYVSDSQNVVLGQQNQSDHLETEEQIPDLQNQSQGKGPSSVCFNKPSR